MVSQSYLVNLAKLVILLVLILVMMLILTCDLFYNLSRVIMLTKLV